MKTVSRKCVVLVIIYLLISITIKAQSQAVQDSINSDDPGRINRSANKAALFSSVIPGLGQAYNKKYWKIPVLYAGLTAIALSVDYNNKNYKTFRTAYKYRVDNDPSTVDEFVSIYPDESALLVRKDYYRRTRDLMIIAGAALYIANIIDAYVDAHLAEFDVSDNLSFRINPALINHSFTNVSSPGFRMLVSLH